MANIRQAWVRAWCRGKRPELPPGSGSAAAPLDPFCPGRRPKTRQMQRAQPAIVWSCPEMRTVIIQAPPVTLAAPGLHDSCAL